MPGSHKCTQCEGKAYVTSSSLREHVFSVHKNNRFCCSWEGCGKRYTASAKLRQHIKSVHELANPFFCPWVGCHAQGSSRRDNVQRHSLKCSKRHQAFANAERSKMPKAISMAATAQHNGDLDRAREEAVRAKLAELDGTALQGDQEGHQVNGQDTVYGSAMPSEVPAVGGLFFQGQQEGHQLNGQDPFFGYDAVSEYPAVERTGRQQQGPGHDAGAFLPHQAQPYFGGLDLPIQNAPPLGAFVSSWENEPRPQPFPQPAPLPLQDHTQFTFTYEPRTLHPEPVDPVLAAEVQRLLEELQDPFANGML